MRIALSRRLFAHLASWILTSVAFKGVDAQQLPGPGPEAVVRSALSALASQRWADVAALVHPEALRQFREEQLHFATEWHDARTEAAVNDSSVSRAVTERVARQWNDAMVAGTRRRSGLRA